MQTRLIARIFSVLSLIAFQAFHASAATAEIKSKSLAEFKNKYAYTLVFVDGAPTPSACYRLTDSELKKRAKWTCTPSDDKMFSAWSCVEGKDRSKATSYVEVVPDGMDECQKALADFNARY